MIDISKVYSASLNSEIVQELVEKDISQIEDKRVLANIRKLIVAPKCEMRPWDYGPVGQEFPCWIVLVHPPSNTSIAYCREGFGPYSPWGLLFSAGDHMSIGMDSAWFSRLEDAFWESKAWGKEKPAGYEVQ